MFLHKRRMNCYTMIWRYYTISYWKNPITTIQVEVHRQSSWKSFWNRWCMLSIKGQCVRIRTLFIQQKLCSKQLAFKYTFSIKSIVSFRKTLLVVGWWPTKWLERATLAHSDRQRLVLFGFLLSGCLVVWWCVGWCVVHNNTYIVVISQF